MRIRYLFMMPLFLVIIAVQYVHGQNSTSAGELSSYQTINSIGMEWPITGDKNHNAVCSVSYRIFGSGEYKQALPLFRIDFNGFNMMAGSILFLEPGTNYEIQLSLNDPDGGASTQNLTITTRKIPQMPVSGNIYYVSPGSGGGTGTEANPFLGMEAAQVEAAPGDVFLLNSGSYGGRFEFTASGTENNYIVWKAAQHASPKFDGVRVLGDYIWIEGITIENQDNALITQSGRNPFGIVIKGNYFRNCNYSIDLNHGGENWYIVDNVIEGDITDFTTGEMSGEGIELEHSNGHVVAYNRISNTADGVSYPGKNCDIFRNEIFNVSDDGIEFDYGYANNRAWENRITTANNNGISFQPMYSAPEYVIRNQVIVLKEDVLKLRDSVDRVLLANNTLVCQSGPVSVDASFLIGFKSNNNLYISVTDRYVWEDNSDETVTDWRTNLDYDGFDWNNNTYAFKWKNERFATLEELQVNYGIEINGRRIRKEEIFNQYNFPASPASAPLQYLTLKEECNAIDAGIMLNNINEKFTGDAPDLGAFEFGQELPIYGPRDNGAVSVSESSSILSKFMLYQNYPNPFNPNTVISYKLKVKSDVVLKIYDILGREIVVLVNEVKNAGDYTVGWNGKNSTGLQVGSGVYFYQLKTGNGFVSTKKMLFIR
jgi:nitrous oxidase accessory protein NosD